jgi:hypothetical protein
MSTPLPLFNFDNVQLMTQEQFWQALGVGRSTYYSRIKNTIPLVMVSPGRLMVSKKIFEEYVANKTLLPTQRGTEYEEWEDEV